MSRVILLAIIAVIMTSCAFLSPKPPVTDPGTPTFVMWCDVDKAYTEWEVLDSYFRCTRSGTIWGGDAL